jgi:thymidylate synthase (FAD)
VKQVTILTAEPTIIPLAAMTLDPAGVELMAEWVRTHRPECLPDGYHHWQDLFPYTPDRETDNELLVELAGRKCYDSFGAKAGKKSNAEYIANTQSGDIPHASIMYHAKMSFFFAGISRRVSHEIIRNYVGADRDEEGSPSQESTRFTHHYGYFVCPPRYLELENKGLVGHFERSMQDAYDKYQSAVAIDVEWHTNIVGKPPTGVAKKRIYEAASSFLPHQAETSFVWTTNPSAIAKFCRERDNEAADLEIQRFARKYKRVCVERWPNLFPQSYMREAPGQR